MTWEQWVIDATMGCKDGLFTFCPIEGDIDSEYSVVIGMNYVSDTPPKWGKVVAIVHADGQEAVEIFCEENAVHLEALKARLENTEEESGGS